MEKFIESLQILRQEEVKLITPFLHTVHLKKNEYWIKEGKVASQIAFIHTGVMRSHYNHDGEEMTSCITFEGDIMCAFSSFISQRPTDENIQALTDTTLQVVSRTDLLYLYDKYPNWGKLGRQVAENMYVEMEQRIVAFQKYSAKERYEQLLQKDNRYIRHIPLQHLASFLGISRETLSRIRSIK
ncbi:Crp/Fnr family transcriptional regulator [Chitinophaga pendula]|uniref:Crp/Fnr family transcriptional regulator n=1 Tax=Chitinophaga TaxID=79328 RepID=UPI000BAFDD96|nr:MULTISPECIES: Crp/Fnr family transcriptional regulator [Chitinophaga]ASZ11007.1 cyclic nucleotide-binding protein [Chitinophaga sp. MD30]UCJ06003.1 Crp/Fnr family transcriptional regulator [Chitinophaga pendula]